MPSATLIEFNQDIIQNRQSRGIAVRNLKRKAIIKIFWLVENVFVEHVWKWLIALFYFRTIKNKLTI